LHTWLEVDHASLALSTTPGMEVRLSCWAVARPELVEGIGTVTAAHRVGAQTADMSTSRGGSLQAMTGGQAGRKRVVNRLALEENGSFARAYRKWFLQF